MNSPSSPQAALVDLLHELERTKAAARRLLARDQAPDDMTIEGASPELTEAMTLLQSARAAILEHPAEARSLVKFLADEGRRFAATAEGQRLADSLLSSQEFEHLRDMWEATTMSILDDLDEPHAVPNAWVDLIREVAADRTSMESLVEGLRPRGLA